jgi:hypothetical protein
MGMGTSDNRYNKHLNIRSIFGEKEDWAWLEFTLGKVLSLF